VLIEHFAGEFPVWLAPVQAVVLPLTDRHLDYARKVSDDLSASGIRVETDDRNEKVGYKIREWETKKVPYMLVVGDKEMAAGNVAVRQHKMGDTGVRSINEFRSMILEVIASKGLTTKGEHP